MISKGRGEQIRLLVKLYRILDSTDGLTVTDIVKRTRMSNRQVYRWMEILEQEKVVVRLPGPPPGRWRRRKQKERGSKAWAEAPSS